MKEEIAAAAGVVDGVAKEIVNKGFTLLEQIAAKIGVTVEYLWPFMVKEQTVQWLTSIMMFIVCAVLSTFVIKHIDTEALRYNYDGDKDKTAQIFLVIIGAILAIMTAVGFVDMWVATPGLLNPEYHALKDLINMIK